MKVFFLSRFNFFNKIEKTLIYNVSILSKGIDKTSLRTGIYFCAKSIFDEVYKSKSFNIRLYCQDDCLKDLKIAIDNGCIDTHGIEFIDINSINCDENMVYLSPIYMPPPEIQRLKIKKFIILYDLIPLILTDYFPIIQETHWLVRIIRNMDREYHYFAISECTKSDFVRFTNINKKKITVMHLGVGEEFRKCSNSEIRDVYKKYGIYDNKKYILGLGTSHKHKNIIRIIRTFFMFIEKNSIEDMMLILAGSISDKFILSIRCLNNYKLHKIKILKYIDDEDRAPLYSGAQWFVFTSRYKGFGLPPLEAMACGCPVITSNSSCLPELVGDSALIIDWDIDEQHIEAYEKCYYNELLRKEMIEKGMARSAQFSWKKSLNPLFREIQK